MHDDDLLGTRERIGDLLAGFIEALWLRQIRVDLNDPGQRAAGAGDVDDVEALRLKMCCSGKTDAAARAGD
jgi:hypothetical protein